MLRVRFRLEANQGGTAEAVAFVPNMAGIEAFLLCKKYQFSIFQESQRSPASKHYRQYRLFTAPAVFIGYPNFSVPVSENRRQKNKEMR